jgi:hypothetical protein
MKLLHQASNLAGVTQVKLIANGLSLSVAHLGRLSCCKPIALAGALFRGCQIFELAGFYFVGNQRFISAAMRSRPACPSASLRRCPSGIMRASEIISVARASQSWLCTGWTTIRAAGPPIINASLGW